MATNTLPQSNSTNLQTHSILRRREMKNTPFGLANELLINLELDSSTLHDCISIRVERVEAITEMMRNVEEYANFKDYKSLMESASFVIDHQVNEIEAFADRIHELAGEVSHG